jgi:hypothetical protein
VEPRGAFTEERTREDLPGAETREPFPGDVARVAVARGATSTGPGFAGREARGGWGFSPYPCMGFEVKGFEVEGFGMEGEGTGRTGVGITGPVTGGGRNGTSMAPVRLSPVISLDPVVRMARVGMEARPTSSATITT